MNLFEYIEKIESERDRFERLYGKAKNERDALIRAVREYDRFNPIRNDLDAYLFHLGQYALGEETIEPDPKDYGVEED